MEGIMTKLDVLFWMMFFGVGTVLLGVIFLGTSVTGTMPIPALVDYILKVEPAYTILVKPDVFNSICYFVAGLACLFNGYVTIKGLMPLLLKKKG